MAILLQVNWVDQCDQPEPHRRIRHIGGISNQLEWKHSQAQAIEGIEQGEFVYYVEKDGRVGRLMVGQTAEGWKYLTLRPEGGPPQLLLEMPKFPSPAPAGSQRAGRQ